MIDFGRPEAQPVRQSAPRRSKARQLAAGLLLGVLVCGTALASPASTHGVASGVHTHHAVSNGARALHMGAY